MSESKEAERGAQAPPSQQGAKNSKNNMRNLFSEQFRTNLEFGAFMLYLSNLVYVVGFGPISLFFWRFRLFGENVC